MVRRNESTAARVRELYEFNPDTGSLTRRHGQKGRSRPSVFTWKYRPAVEIDGVSYLAHRAAWLHYYGEWPGLDIDHINGDRCDNRISNLRLATHGQNMQNRGKTRRNKSGYKCVYATPHGFCAEIRHMNRKTHLGSFNTPEDAYAAYLEAARKLHGDFSRG